ncbi:hypothetical protein K7862_12950 [Streptomyces sp. PLK6-54]|uniref:Cobyrinic acid a,c-diamide synthase n=1 Tax=Actinacidiphila acidipaludis TaxID=2873382 RepID=A0ABS7Q7W6_9ACTN|nr:hypothetical protein [Streptomyces acidipaludis]
MSLPGADELFRTTGGAALQAPQSRQHTGGEGQSGAPGDTRLRPVPDAEDKGRPAAAPDADGGDAAEHEHVGRDRGRDTGRDPGRESGRDAGRESGREPGRDTARETGLPPAQRRNPAADRPAVPSASATTATVTATVTPQVPAAGPAAAKSPVPPPVTATPQPQPARRKAPRQNRRPSGRERHDEKITVYVSAEELMDLEHARLVLRGEHGLAIDRGRIVREAVAVVLADLESRGDASILVRRLRGR